MNCTCYFLHTSPENSGNDNDYAFDSNSTYVWMDLISRLCNLYVFALIHIIALLSTPFENNTQ